MPRRQRSLAPLRKKLSAAALGTKVRPTGRERRQSPIQVLKRNAVVATGRSAGETGRFRIKDFRPAVAGQEEKRAVRPTAERVQTGMGYNSRTWHLEPTYAYQTVPREVVVQEARKAAPAYLTVEKIPRHHTPTRSGSRGGGKTFGSIATSGKRGTFKSRKSLRRGGIV